MTPTETAIEAIGELATALEAAETRTQELQATLRLQADRLSEMIAAEDLDGMWDVSARLYAAGQIEPF